MIQKTVMAITGMNMRKTHRIVQGRMLLAILSLLLLDVFQSAAQEQGLARPKNMIVMISDGCGYHHILATDYFMDGRAGSQVYESFPIRLGMSNFPARISDSSALIPPDKGYLPDSAWSSFSYPLHGWTDSAPAATTMATGQKTYNASIGMDIQYQPMVNITQRAEALGKSTGVVTTVPISHATPAGFTAHNKLRNHYREIALEMLLDTRLDVIMGCGHPDYDSKGNPITAQKDYQYVGGKAAWDALLNGAEVFIESSPSGNTKVKDADGDGKADPWTLIQDREDFVKLSKGKVPARVLGVARTYYTLQQERKGKIDTLPFAIPFIENVPTLKEMAAGAIHVLENNQHGFFLMIEGGAVDWAGHNNELSRLIEEEESFNETVSEVIHWIDSHGGWNETLLIVTADHESGYITGPGEKDPSPITNPLINNGKGKVPGMRFNTKEHTNQLVPFFAKGAGCEIFLKAIQGADPVRGSYIDNAEMGKRLFELWPLPGDPSRK